MNANVKNIPSPVSSFVCLFFVLKNYHFNPQVIIGCLGNIGNLISIVVLSTSEMRNSFNLLLIFLAVRKQSDDIPEFIQGIYTLDFLSTFFKVDDVDLIVPVIFCSPPLQSLTTAWPGSSCGPTTSTQRYTHTRSQSFSIPSTTSYSISRLVWLSWWPLKGTLISDIAAGVEMWVRYNAVCRPHYFHYRTVVSSSLTGLTSYVLPVVILSTLINIPKFFETEFVSWKTFSKVRNYVETWRLIAFFTPRWLSQCPWRNQLMDLSISMWQPICLRILEMTLII